MASGLGRADVDEVDGLAVDLGDEVRDGVHPRLLRAPVELLPALDHVLQVGDRGAVVPAVAGAGDRVAGVGQPVLQVVELGLRDRDGEGADRAGLPAAVVVVMAATLGVVQERFVPAFQTRFGGLRCTETSGPTAGPARAAAVPHDWSGAELAERLQVSDRTVRNDIDRLRQLGYPVDAVRGRGGHYRLGVGAKLPPLLLDDDEAVAVAVGLRAATGVTGIEETSARALAKLEQVLPHRLQRRVNAVRDAVQHRARRTPGPTSTDPEVDAALLDGCSRGDPRPRGDAVRLPRWRAGSRSSRTGW